MTTLSNTESSYRTHLILGGARSGKSSYAEGLVGRISFEHNLEKIYIATAEAHDDEMAQRIDTHQGRRGASWTTLEVPLDLIEAIDDVQDRRCVVLIDCLTLWLSNLFTAEKDVTKCIEKLASLIEVSNAHLVFVSNEIGLGLVPETELGRKFRDQHGILNQSVAARVEHVVFVAAGIRMQLKA